MPKIESSANGAILIDNKPYNVGNLELLVNANFTEASIYHIRYQKNIVGSYPWDEWTDDTDTPFASYQDFIDYLDTFFFRKVGGGGSGQGWDGQVNNRNDLPTAIPPNAGEIYLVENPVTVTVLGIPYKTYQSGLYIRDTENGNLDDWRRLNVKVKFTSTEFRIVDPADTGKQFGFLANLITSGIPRFLTAQDKDYTIADDADVQQNASDIVDLENDVLGLQNDITDLENNKQDKVGGAVEDNISTWDNAGNTKDSGVPVSDISDNASDIADLETDVLNLQTDVADLENTRVISVNSGTDITVDNTDPLNPIINYTGTGGGGGGGTTAGIINRNYFTGDSTVLPSGTHYDVLANDRGTVASQTQVLALDDNQKLYYTQDFIGELTAVDSVVPKGTYQGQLTCEVSGNGGNQEWTVEVYLCDADGNPQNSGISGAPVGDLGFQVITILQTGEVDILANNPTQLDLGGEVLEDLNVPANSRARYHTSAEKIGAAGGVFNYTIYFGSDYESYIDVPNIRNSCFDSLPIASVDGTQASANTLYAVKTLVPYDMKVANLGTIISSSGVGTVTLGVYDDSVNKDLIVSVDIVSPSNGNVSANTGQVDDLTAGSYVWLAYKEDFGSVTFFKNTTVTDDDICVSQFFGGAGLPADLSGAFASNVAPYVTVCS